MINIPHKNLFTFLIGAILLTFLGCAKKSGQDLPSKNWKLVWSDDFVGAAGSAPDNSKWVFDLGAGGWGNAELQTYTNNAANVKLDGDGKLAITALSSANGYTSARLKTKGKFDQTYGRFEARIKTPTGPGIWPAFWMLGANIDSKPWPQCGEIDILEQKGQQSSVTYGTIHGPGYAGGGGITKAYSIPNSRFDTDYHIYAVECTENQVDFFVDNYLYHRVTNKDAAGEWVFNRPFFILLNVAVGGNFVGFPNNATPFPQTMLVDYVKVYQAQ